MYTCTKNLHTSTYIGASMHTHHDSSSQWQWQWRLSILNGLAWAMTGEAGQKNDQDIGNEYLQKLSHPYGIPCSHSLQINRPSLGGWLVPSVKLLST